MSDFDLGTARGKIDLDASGAIRGSKQADTAFKSIDDGAKSASHSSTAVGTALVGFGAAAVLAFGLAVKASADFEKKLSDFSSLGKDYKDNIDQIREKALQLGADTAFSAGEAADAMVELGKQGLSVADIMDGAADATTSLAAAGGIDLADAASISAAALNQFKLEAKDLPHIADLLAGAANASATGVSEIGQALKFVGPVANAVGLTIEDTAAAIALLANNGIDAGQAGTALRAILSRLQPASAEAATAMSKLGLITADGKNQFFQANGEIKSMSDIVGVLHKSLSGLTAQQQAQALKTIFGTEALAAANVIAGESSETFKELQKQIGDVKAADVAKEKMNNLAGAIEEFKGSVETAMIRAGAPFQKGLTGIVQAATQIINVFSNLNPEIQKWIGYAVAATGVAALVVGGIILLTDAIAKAKVAFAAFNLVISSNPLVRLVIILAAVAGAIFAAYKNIAPFRDAVDKLWDTIQPVFDGIKEKVGQVLNWLSNTVLPAAIQKFGELKDKAVEIAGWLGDKLSGPINTAWTFIQDKIGTVVSWITGTVVPNIQSAWSRLPEGLGSVVEAVENFLVPKLTAAFEGVKSAVGNALTFLQTTFGPAANKVWTDVQVGAQTLKDWFLNEFAPGVRDFFVNTIQPKWLEFTAWVTGTFVPAVTNALGTLHDAAVSKVSEAMTAAGEAVATGGFQDKLTEIGNTIRNAIGTAIGFITDTLVPKVQAFIAIIIEQFGLFQEWANVNLGPVFKAISELISAVFTAVGPLIQQALDFIKTILGVFVVVVVALWNLFGESILNSVMAIWGIIRGVIEGFLKIITGIIQVATAVISGDWTHAWEGILNIIKGVGQIIGAVVGGLVELIVGQIQGLSNGVMRLIGFAWDWILGKTREIFDGILNSVREKIESVRSFLESAANFIKDVFHIDLYGIGRSIIEGFLNGLKSMFGAVQDAFNWITDKIPDWKGPADKDKKLLVDNGQLIMQGLISGIQSQVGEVKAMLGTVAPMMSNTIQPAPPPSSAAAGNNINIQFHITGANPDEFVSAVEGSGLLGRLTSAARSRRT